MSTNPFALSNIEQGGSAAAPATDNPFSLQVIQRDQKQDLRVGLQQAVRTNPDHAAEVDRLAQRYPAPKDVLLRNLQDVQLQAAVDAADEKLGGSPKLADYMRTSPWVTKQSHDDLDALTQVAQFFSDTGGSVKAGVFGAAKGASGLGRAAAEFVAPPLDILEGVTAIGGNPLRRLAEGFAMLAEQNAASAKAAAPKTTGILDSGFQSGIQSLTQNLLTLPMAFMGPGGQSAALAGMTGFTGGNAYEDAREKGLPMSQAIPFAASQAAIEYATEKLPLGALLKDVKVGTPFLETLARQVAMEVPGEQVATILQDLNEWAVLNPDKPFTSYLDERPSAAAQTLVATIVGAGGNVAVVKGIEKALTLGTGNAAKIADAERVNAGLQAAMQAAAASKLRERNPETFKQLVQYLADNNEGQTPTSVFIDAQVLAQSGVNVAEVFPGVAEQMDAALATNGSVEVPISEVLTAAPGTPLEQVFLQNARATPDGISMAEAEQAFKQADQWKAEADRVMAEAQDQAAWQQSADNVKANLLGQLNTAGRFTSDVNEAYATLVRDFYATMAGRQGITPEELYQRYPLRIAAQGMGGQQLDQATKLAGLRDAAVKARSAYADFETAVQGGQEPDADTYFTLSDAVNNAEQALTTALEAVPDDAFAVQATTSDGRMLMLNPSAQKPGHYQLTRFGTDGAPWGDTQYPTKAQALRDFMDEADIATVKDFSGELNQPPFNGTEQATTPIGDATEIEVDGKMRPALNSNGQPIHWSVEGVRNFWRWFSDSRVVDKTGRPVPVFHGSTADIEAFDPAQANDRMYSGGTENTVFFTDNADVAASYAGRRTSMTGLDATFHDGGNVTPVYLKISKPLKANAKGENWRDVPYKGEFYSTAELTEVAKSEKKDGMVVSKVIDHRDSGITGDKTKKPSTTYAVFNPTQIKSATGNSGAFDGQDANILRQNARGTFSPDQLLLTLNENADLSTFLHESGHFFLEVMADLASQPNAPTDVADDMNRLLKWFGIKGDEFVGGADSGAPLAQNPTDQERLDAEALAVARGASAEAVKTMSDDELRLELFRLLRPVRKEPAAKTKTLKALSKRAGGATAEQLDEQFGITVADDGLVQIDKLTDENAKVIGDIPVAFYHHTSTALLPAIQQEGLKVGKQTNFFNTQAGVYVTLIQAGVPVTTYSSRAAKVHGGEPTTLRLKRRISDVIPDPDDADLAWAQGKQFITPGVPASDLAPLSDEFAQDGNLPTDNTQPAGRTPLEVWNAMTLDQKRPHHERFAESFEQYLLEGKAPSAELQPLFRKFRAWMVNVYKSLTQFMRGRNLKLSDEVRQVFDRMLAAEDAIAQQEEVSGLLPDFDATNEAIEKLQARSLRDLKWTVNARSRALKELTAEAESLRREARMDARREVMTHPVYRAYRFLTAKMSKADREAVKPVAAPKSVDGPVDESIDSMFVAIAKLGGLDRAEVESQWGFDKKERGPSPLFGKPLLRRTGGLSLDAMGERLAEYGYLAKDENGKYDMADFEAAFDSEYRGSAVYAYGFDYARAQGEQRAGEGASEDTLGAGRFDLTALKAIDVPEDVIAKLTERGMTAKDGIHPDILADMFGFDGGQEFAKVMATAFPMGQEIEGTTDRLMLERHGELATPEAIEEAANDAVHNEARAKSLATELKAQADMLNTREQVGVDAEADAVIAVTKPITPDAARKAVAGKTEKPGGVDPVTWLDDGREYRVGDVPLDLFVDNEEPGKYDGTVNAERAADYAARNPADAPPVIATQGRTGGKLRIMDGGHRITAARLRGDKTIKAIVRVKTKAASNGSKITVNALTKAAKEFAANLAARRKVKDLKGAAAQHRAAEAKAGKRWQEATTKADTQAAVAAKRDQVLNNATVKALNEAQAEAKKIVEFFRKVTKDGNEKLVDKGRDPDVVNAMRAILAAYDVAPRLEKGALEYMELVAKNDPTMYGALQPSVQGAMNNAKPMAEMTMEELRGLHDEMRAMWHLAKRSRQMEVDGNLLDIEDAADELVNRMRDVGIPLTIPGERGAITTSEEAGIKLQFAKAILSRVEQWAERLDGKFGGPFLRLVFQPVKDAADRYRTDRVAYRKKFTALLDGIAPTLKPGPIDAPELGYKFGNARDSGTAELLHAILHTGNESNKRKLLLGRGWATENADGTLDTSRWDAFIQRMVDEGYLTKAHYDFAQGVWDLLEEMKPLAQKTHREVFGRYFAEVTADAFDTPFGSYRGGYVPAQTDSRLVKDAKLRELAEGENESMAYAFPASPSGFTKSRVEYNKPLLLDLRALAQHMDKVLLFSHMQGAVTDVRRLLTDKRVSYALDRLQPGAYEGMLIPWLNRAARQVVETPTIGDRKLSRFLSAMRSRAGMALMFANLSNTVQQVTGFSLAAVKVKPSLMMSATGQFVANPKQTREAVAGASAYMRDRMLNEVGAMNDTVEQILVNPGMYERAQAWTQRHAYFLQAAVDNTMSPIIWTAAYNQGIEQKMTHGEAVRFADGVIRQTQGSTLPEDISRFESGPAAARLFTQFVSYFNMMANTNATAVKQIADEMGLRKGAGKLVYVALAGLLAPIWVAEAIAQAFKGGPEDEDDDGYLDDWLAAVFGLGTIKGLVATVPIAGQAAQLVVNQFNANPADDKFSLSPAVSLLESAVRAPKSVYEAVVDDGKVQKAVRDVAAAATMATGLPFFAAARPLGYAAGVAAGEIDPTSGADAMRGVLTGNASPESKN